MLYNFHFSIQKEKYFQINIINLLKKYLFLKLYYLYSYIILISY